MRFLRLDVLCLLVCASTAVAQDARTLIREGHLKRARQLVTTQLQANANDPEALANMAELKLYLGDVDGATTMIEKSIASRPNDSRAHLVYVDALSRKVDKVSFFQKISLGRKIKAEMEKAYELDPKSADAVSDLVQFYLEAPSMIGGGVGKANEMADKLVSFNAPRGYLSKVAIARHEKQLDSIEGLYLKAVEAGPNDFLALNNAASYFAGEKVANFEKAAQFAQRAIDAAPTRIGGYSSLAYVLATRRQWSDLDKLLARAEKNVADDLSPYYVAGRVTVVAKSDPARAEKYFRKYLSQEPELNAQPLAAAHWRLGLALEQQGKRDEAVKEIQTAVQMKPDLKDAQADLKRLK